MSRCCSCRKKAYGGRRESFPRLHASRRAILKLEIIHQAGECWCGFVVERLGGLRIQKQIQRPPPKNRPAATNAKAKSKAKEPARRPSSLSLADPRAEPELPKAAGPAA